MKKYEKARKDTNKQKTNLMSIFLGFAFNSIALPLAIAFIWLFISAFFLYPKLEIKVDKEDYGRSDTESYVIMISNPTKQDIYNLEFSVRFDEKYPLLNYSLEEINFKSGILLRSHEDYDMRQNGERSSTPALVSGARGATDKFPSGISTVLHIAVNRDYDGERGDVLPPTLEPQLRSFSYLVSYKYKPLGFFSQFFIEKNQVRDFQGRK
jgi:hypothetical protein